MPMKPYAVLCYRKNCQQPAEYKVAARWSDGVTHELKTYFLCCRKCLPGCYREALQRRSACRLSDEEILELPSIFSRADGVRYLFTESCPAEFVAQVAGES